MLAAPAAGPLTNGYAYRSSLPAILAFAPNDWAGPWMNRQQLLSRLAARGWPVCYSTGALTVWHRGTEDWRTASWLGRHERHDGVLVDRPGKICTRWPRLRAFDAGVVRAYCAMPLRRAGADPANAIAYVFHPSFHPYVDALGCRWTVYHPYDAFARQPGWSEQLAREEAALVACVDLVIASSPEILSGLPGADARRALVLTNGADALAFARGPALPCPPDLAAIPRPRIGYTGRLTRKVDFPLIETMARQRPDWNWALVGPVQSSGIGDVEADPAIARAYRACRELPNVHFLGAKPHTDLPAYAGHMDVNAMCYRSDGDGWWRAISPLKLHEYLATGRPVVSADLGAVRPFADVVSNARGGHGWIAAIERALREDSAVARARRREVARANSWDKRVDRLEEALLGCTGSGRTAYDAPRR